MPNDDPRFWSGRYESRRTIKAEVCAISRITGCGGPLERHHKDEDPSNNDLENVIVLCRSHHKLVHSGKIDLNDPSMPRYIISSGKRRYEGTYKYGWSTR